MDDSIVVNRGRPGCLGEAQSSVVEEAPNGRPGPWIKTTCGGCSLEWYAKKI